jgi:DNA-binding MurR/RpiR family transcriptional regulator
MVPRNQQHELSPASYEALEEAIAARYPSLSPQLQRISRFALEYPNEMALETVANLAGRASVQPSSMVRFAQALGYDGFSDMQQVFRSHLVNRSDSYRDRIEQLQKNGEGGEHNGATTLAGFVTEGMESLALLRDSVSIPDLNKAIRLLVRANDIYVLAERRAFPVAFYLSYALSRLEQRVHLLDGVGGTLRQQAAMVRKSDATIAVSFPPYSPQVAEIVAEQHSRGVPTVAMSDSPVSPVALEADIVFPIKLQSERPFRSLVAPMCLAQTLVVALGYRLAAIDK